MAVGSANVLEMGAVTPRASIRQQSSSMARWVGVTVAAIAMVGAIAVISRSDSSAQVRMQARGES
jgi:hypothetical protein